MLTEVIEAIRPVAKDVLERARTRHATLTKPPGSLGKLEALGVRLAGVYGSERPQIEKKAVVVFAADHGVTRAGVSAYPQAVTAQMVSNFLRGGAAVNALARVAGAELYVVDVGVDADLEAHPQLLNYKVKRGSDNLLTEPALTGQDAIAACAVGVRVARRLRSEGVDLVAAGEMGIGNTTAAAALSAVFLEQPVRTVTGRGTGIDDAGLATKISVIERALARHRPNRNDPLDALAQVGGLEIAALTGFYLAAAAERMAVVLDGFIATSAALVAVALNAHVKDYLFASHLSTEPGHALQLEHLGLEPLFDLNLRLGEGSGAVLALPLLESAAAVLSSMATFAEAGVSDSARESNG